MAERDLSRSETYTARPTVEVDGRTDDKVTSQLTAMRLTESEGGLCALELRFDNLERTDDGSAQLAFEDERVIKLGSSLEVSAGDEDDPQEIFRGKVTGLEATFSAGGAPELVVLAEDALQRARMARRTKVHDDATISGLANDLANALGLRPVVTGLSDNLGRQVQLNESDLAFLRRLLACHDGELQVIGDELHVSPRRDVRRSTVELDLYSQLRRVRITADLAHQATEITVGGWDVSSGRRASGSSTGENLGPGSGRTGADLLRQAFGDRSEHLVEIAASSDAEARAIADAAFDRRARRFVCVDATAEGNPALRVGAHVTLRGTSPRFDNTYYVVRACHRYDRERGYETDFEAESAYLGDAS
jgi:phage protein D